MGTTYVAHFVYEESQFSTILDADFDPADHKVRHDAIVNTLKGVVVPVSEEVTNFIENWLVQHIKNTDFKYKGKMPVVHAIPEPFRWTSYYAVLYEHMDTEHKHLFDCLAQVEATPVDAALVTSCLKSYEDHFRHEESLLKDSFTLRRNFTSTSTSTTPSLLRPMAFQFQCPKPSSTLVRTGFASTSLTPI